MNRFLLKITFFGFISSFNLLAANEEGFNGGINVDGTYSYLATSNGLISRHTGGGQIGLDLGYSVGKTWGVFATSHFAPTFASYSYAQNFFAGGGAYKYWTERFVTRVAVGYASLQAVSVLGLALMPFVIFLGSADDIISTNRGVGFLFSPAFELYKGESFAFEIHAIFLPQVFTTSREKFAISQSLGFGFHWH